MLPKITYPISVFEQPSTKKKLKFRPFLVKEEKVLLMAKQSESFQEIMQAVKSILQDCCQEKDFDVNQIPIFDLEILFLRLRAVSVNNVEKISIQDDEDQQKYNLIIDLNSVNLIYPEEVPSNKIQVGKDITIVMKYPTSDIFEEEDIEKKFNKEGVYELVLTCIDKIFDKDTLLKFTLEEKKEFLENLDIKTFNKMRDFLLSIPKLELRIEYKNKFGNTKTILFNSLRDFFIFL